MAYYFEKRYGPGRRLLDPDPPQEHPQLANHAAPRQRPARNAPPEPPRGAALPPVNPPAPVHNAAPRQGPPARPSTPEHVAAQGYELPAHYRRAGLNYHDTVAQSQPVDLMRLAFEGSATNPGEPRLSYVCEMVPEDIALTYDQLVERGLAEPRAGQGERPAAAGPRDMNVSPGPSPASPPQPRAQTALPAPPPIQNEATRAAPRAAAAVNANANAATIRDPFAALGNRRAPLERSGPIDMTVNINTNTIGHHRQRARQGSLSAPIHNFHTTTAMGDFPTIRPQGLNFPIHLPRPRSSRAWLDDDAEARELYQRASTLLEQKRAQRGESLDWVTKCQGRFHKVAARDGIEAAKALMRDAPRTLRRWERELNMMGGTGGMVGGGAVGFGGGVGRDGMGWDGE